MLKKYWRDYAEAVVKGIASYLGVPYTFSGEMLNDNYYIVKSGDSLWSISKKIGLSVNQLKELNINKKLISSHLYNENNNFFSAYIKEYAETASPIRQPVQSQEENQADGKDFGSFSM